MKKYLLSIGLLYIISFLGAQELFVVTDPASNMPQDQAIFDYRNPCLKNF